MKFSGLSISQIKSFRLVTGRGMNMCSDISESSYRLRDALNSFSAAPNENQAIFLLDGGTGEELFRRGMPDDRKTWSAKAVVEPKYHKVLKDVHKSYLESGSKAITTNSYGITPGVGFELEEIRSLCAISGRLAREAVDEFAGIESEKKYILGSLGPLNGSYRPDKILSHQEGLQTYSIIASSLAPYVDCFIAETMSCYEEAIQAMHAVGHLDVPSNRSIIVSYTLGSEGKLRDGEEAISAVTRTIRESEDSQVELLGVMFNCCEPESITKAYDSISQDMELVRKLESRKILLGAYANRLTPVEPGWDMETSNGPQPFRNDVTPEEYFQKFVSNWMKFSRVKLIGGCCGITPEHISYLRKSLP